MITLLKNEKRLKVRRLGPTKPVCGLGFSHICYGFKFGGFYWMTDRACGEKWHKKESCRFKLQVIC
jgi:hypothetical protein